LADNFFFFSLFSNNRPGDFQEKAIVSPTGARQGHETTMLTILALAFAPRAPLGLRAGGSRVAMQARDPDGPKSGAAVKSGPAVSQMSSQLSGMREQMAADPQASAMMTALRGSNFNDDAMADAGTRLQVVEMDRGSGEDVLPVKYDPVRLSAYFAKRPGAVATRIAQVLSTSFGWLIGAAWAGARGDLVAGSEGEVRQVRALRNIIVSLGPFFIKLGQALSIRPDILSPKAMVELQQLCDKVPSFDSGLAFETIREEMGKEVSLKVSVNQFEKIYLSFSRPQTWVTVTPVDSGFASETIKREVWKPMNLSVRSSS